VVSWQRRTTGGYRVGIEVNRFEAVPGGSVILKGIWGMASHDGSKVFVTQGFSINQPLSGKDYSNVVAGMSQALGAFSEEIATSVKSLIATRGMQQPQAQRPNQQRRSSERGVFMKRRKTRVHVIVCLLALLLAAPQGLIAQPAAPQPAGGAQQPAAGQKTFSQGELEALLAPIALYPDDLLAQVFMASTYPWK